MFLLNMLVWRQIACMRHKCLSMFVSLLSSGSQRMGLIPFRNVFLNIYFQISNPSHLLIGRLLFLYSDASLQAC